MDVRSFKIANLLLDNPENKAVLEITLIGPTLEFTSATIIAITGGDFQPTINGEPAPMYTALYMNKGDVLKFGSARTGSRAYIAFSSYLDIPVVMGSRCTNLKSKLGGFKRAGNCRQEIISDFVLRDVTCRFSFPESWILMNMTRQKQPYVWLWDPRIPCSASRGSIHSFTVNIQ